MVEILEEYELPIGEKYKLIRNRLTPSSEINSPGRISIVSGIHGDEIEGQYVCYESKSARETEEGTVYTGDVKARLNGEEDIVLHVEWDPEKPDQAEPLYGHVTGYDLVDIPFAFMEKGSRTLNTNDRLEFLFDCYDDQGNLVRTETYGKTVTVVTMDRLKAEDTKLPPGRYSFSGHLTDVYQRDLLTETIEWQLAD